MDTKEAFEKAVSRSRTLPQKPSNDELLKLYGLFKQGSEGDNHGERPGGFDFKGAAKYDAWKDLEGTEEDAARSEYVILVDSLFAKYS